MAKCRECNGQGSDFDPSDFSNKRCLTCNGTGEVSDSPDHMSVPPHDEADDHPHFAFGAMMPDWMEGKTAGETAGEIASVNLLKDCRLHFMTFYDQRSAKLVQQIDQHLKWLGVES